MTTLILRLWFCFTCKTDIDICIRLTKYGSLFFSSWVKEKILKTTNSNKKKYLESVILDLMSIESGNVRDAYLTFLLSSRDPYLVGETLKLIIDTYADIQLDELGKVERYFYCEDLSIIGWNSHDKQIKSLDPIYFSIKDKHGFDLFLLLEVLMNNNLFTSKYNLKYIWGILYAAGWVTQEVNK